MVCRNAAEDFGIGYRITACETTSFSGIACTGYEFGRLSGYGAAAHIRK